MANIKQIIDRVNDIKPNAFKEETKLAWIGELEGKIAADVMLMGIEDIRQLEYTYPDSLEAKPLVGFPHDGIYEQYLCAKIDYANGEYSKYQNTMEMFNAHYDNFLNWFIRTYAPAQGYRCSTPGKQPYYISAYGLAVQQGYKGTLEEWLKSLVGEKGDTGDITPEALAAVMRAETLTAEAERRLLSVVSFTPQIKTEKEKIQATENIGVSPYYHTTRENWKIGEETNSDRYANAEFIWSLYDDLQNEYGADVVRKKEVHNNDGTFTNYVYEISTGEYSTVGVFAERYGADYQIKKPKYLILNGIHGNERKTCLSTYRFIRDVLRGHNVPQSFREGVTLCVMPVGNPSGVNAFTRANDNSVNINRNFDWNWVEGSDSNGACSFGEPAESEKETQAIANWLKSYTDEETGKNTADLFIDFHNSGHINEQVLVIALADALKKIAMRGVDRIIPYWRDVVGYPKQMEAITTEGVLVEKDVIYSYTIAAEIPGVSYGYAQEVLGINSLAIEASVFYGKFSDYNANLHSCPPETVAMGAEALGNILLEFYEQSFMSEVTEDMKAIDDKLETLLASVHSGFRMESGVYEVTQDQAGTGSVYYFNIPCSSGAKLFFIQADDTEVIDTENNRTTYGVIMNTTQSTTGPYWLIGALGSYGEQVGYKKNRGLISHMGNASYSDGSTKWIPRETGMPCDNTNGIQIATYGVKAGKYNWAAYYWNEQEE